MNMDKAFTRMARFLGVGGVAAIVFGIIVLVWPGMSLVALTALFGAFALVYGVFGIGAGLNLLAHRSTEWVAPLVGGIGGVIIGIITFLHPAITVLALTYLIAAWAFIVGVISIAGAIELWGEVRGAVWLIVSGALSILFGILVAVRPGAGLLAILWLIGLYAILAGVAQLVGAYRIHQFRTGVKSVMGAPHPTT